MSIDRGPRCEAASRPRHASSARSAHARRRTTSEGKSGSDTIKDSITRNNPRGTFETPNLPGFYVIAKGPAQIVNSQILR